MSIDLSRLAAGTFVPGTKWVVCGKLGEGGMGIVFEVVKEPGIRGAMKIVRPDIGGRPDFVARFLDEVRILAKLEHRNIVRVFDFDRIEDETPFVVMELLVGGTLRQAMRAQERALPGPIAYEIIRQACDGLDRAHSSTPSVIHRDLKPENIFLHAPPGDQPFVKVLDFGLAVLADGEREHGLFGTPRYMAPEQLRGERATPRSDIYAAALVLYEMLTGRLPWDFSAVRVEEAHLSIPPEPPSHFAPWIPPAVDAHIVSALAKNPAERPHDAFAFMAKLYALQWAQGQANPIDVNTTAPTLATLADVSRGLARMGGVDSQQTYRGMTPPPMDGRSLELAPLGLVHGETDKLCGPVFSPETMARGELHPTKVPAGNPSVDRNAPTPSHISSTQAVPKHRTEPLMAMPSPSPPVVREVVHIAEAPAATGDEGTARSIRRESPSTARWRAAVRRHLVNHGLPLGLFATVTLVGTLVVFRIVRPAPVPFNEPPARSAAAAAPALPAPAEVAAAPEPPRIALSAVALAPAASETSATPSPPATGARAHSVVHVPPSGASKPKPAAKVSPQDQFWDVLPDHP